MRVVIAVSLGLLLAWVAGADVLETRDGRLLEGHYRGGTDRSLRFEVEGRVHVVPVEEVLALTFGAQTRSAADAAATDAPGGAGAAATPPAAAPRRVRVPAGTRLRVRIADSIDPRRAIRDDRFGGALELGLAAGDTPVIAAGTRVYGRIAEVRATGPVATRLRLELDQLTFQGALVPIVTGPHQLAALDATGPARADSIPERPEFAAGTLLDFRLLQPVELVLY